MNERIMITQCFCRNPARNMAPRHSRLSALLVVTFLLGVQCKHTVVKRESISSNVKCHTDGRFYRNPDRAVESMWTRNECAKYYLCVDREVYEFRCSEGLLFDVNRQKCDTPQNVFNCDITTEILIPKPLLELASCANETHLGCSDGVCIPAEYFCDGSNDCNDASDEGWCDVSYDPNAAAPCDPRQCELPNCFCTTNGTETPGHLIPNQTPQMIVLTFTGSVNHENWDIYTKHLFTPERKNPNGMPIKATFFVSHLYTNYRHVQKLWNDGHEIAINSITNRGPEEWWSKNATVEDWFDEMVGQANIINRFSRVRMEDFRGLRAPYLSVGWNRQFLMMQEFGFVYDATVVAPRADPPYWPYTLDYKMPHGCTGNNQYCPTRSYAGLWEMVINPLSFGNDTCATIDRCPSKPAHNDVYNILKDNFKRHYLTNRAPFGIHLNSTWLKSGDYLAEFKRFMDEILKLPDVYFVTNRQVIEWIKRPTPVLQLKNFFPWMTKDRRFKDFEVACAQATTCKLPAQMMSLDRYMITCTECPKTYPWLRNEFGVE